MSTQFIVILAGFALFALPPLSATAAGYDSGLDCIIEPSSTVNVGSEVPGVIEEITVDRGATVRRGDVIIRLDSKVERATMESRRARYEFAQTEYERRRGLYLKGMIPARDFDEAERDLKITQRDFEETEKIYERRIIRSPIDGIVVERLSEPGERVEEKPILKLVQLSPLYVEVIAPASMLLSVKAGDRAAVRPESPFKAEYIGNVRIVDNVVDAASGTFGIRVELENKNYGLPSGLKCKVRFLGRKRSRKAPSPARKSARESARPKRHDAEAQPIKQPLP